MGGATLRGHGNVNVALTGDADLDADVHRGVTINLNANTLTIETTASAGYDTGHQCVVWNSYPTDATVTAASGVRINGVDGGSFVVGPYEGYSLFHVGGDYWYALQADVS